MPNVSTGPCMQTCQVCQVQSFARGEHSTARTPTGALKVDVTDVDRCGVISHSITNRRQPSCRSPEVASVPTFTKATTPAIQQPRIQKERPPNADAPTSEPDVVEHLCADVRSRSDLTSSSRVVAHRRGSRRGPTPSPAAPTSERGIVEQSSSRTTCRVILHSPSDL